MVAAEPVEMLPESPIIVVGDGATVIPVGIWMLVSGVSVFTFPLLSPIHPCTSMPSGLTRLPLVSKLKAPARV